MKISFLLCALVLSMYSISQDISEEKKNTIGVELCALGIAGVPSPISSLLFSIENKKHFIAIGPLLTKRLNLGYYHYYGSQTRNAHTISGFLIQYNYYPNDRAKVFDFFFQNQLSFNYFTDKGIDYLSNYGANNYNSYLLNIGNFIGYGFNAKFLKHFYSTQSIGLGMYYRNLTRNFENFSDKIDKGFLGGITFKIGIGYIK